MNCNFEDAVMSEAMPVNATAACNRLINLLRENQTNSARSANKRLACSSNRLVADGPDHGDPAFRREHERLLGWNRKTEEKPSMRTISYQECKAIQQWKQGLSSLLQYLGKVNHPLTSECFYWRHRLESAMSRSLSRSELHDYELFAAKVRKLIIDSGCWPVRCQPESRSKA